MPKRSRVTGNRVSTWLTVFDGNIEWMEYSLDQKSYKRDTELSSEPAIVGIPESYNCRIELPSDIPTISTIYVRYQDKEGRISDAFPAQYQIVEMHNPNRGLPVIPRF